MKKLAWLLLIILLTVGLFSCKKKTEIAPEDVFFEVEFSTTYLPYAATPPDKVSVKEGDALGEPAALDANPTAGYVVIWTRDPVERIRYDFSTPVKESFVLYAVEVPRSYSITYLLEQGTNATGNPTSYTKATETIVLVDPVLPFGYVFDRWCYFDDPDSDVKEIPKGTEGDIVLRAVMHPRTFKLYYRDSVDPDPNPTSYIYGTELVLEQPQREGYIFLGYTIYMDTKSTLVESLTAEFMTEHWEAFKKGNGGESLFLVANWEQAQ